MFETANCCRTCMKGDGTLVNLFEPMEMEDGRSLEMDRILTMCTNLLVSKVDGLPQTICYDCVEILKICDNFSKQAQNAEKEFRKLISVENTVKDEVFEVKGESDIQNKLDCEFEIKPESDFTNKLDYDFGFDSENFAVFDNNDCKIESPKEENCYECKNCQKRFSVEGKFLKHEARCRGKKLACYICSKHYKTKTLLDKHLSKHAKEHSCSVCSIIFPTASALAGHMVQHDLKDDVKVEIDDKSNHPNVVNSYKCSECSATFGKAQSLAMHRRKHVRSVCEVANYICDICAKPFSMKNLLRRHLKLHSSDRPYQCTKCKKKYSRQDELEVHVRLKHELLKRYTCSICNKAFAQRCNLVDHERTHTGETPYLCSECGKGFRNSSNLRQHLQRHTGLKPYACKLCPMTFATKGQMTTHERTHTGAHPHRCEQCGAAFTKLNSLKKHKLIHLGVRPFACPTCNMRFTVKDHLTRHQRIHTGEKPYKCGYCERAFTQSNDLVKHTRAHVGQNVYQCKICGMRFRLVSELKQHYPSHYDSKNPTGHINGVMNQEMIDQQPYLVHKPQDDDKVPLEALAPPVEDKTFDRTITITYNSEGVSKDITISIRPEDIGQGF